NTKHADLTITLLFEEYKQDPVACQNRLIREQEKSMEHIYNSVWLDMYLAIVSKQPKRREWISKQRYYAGIDQQRKAGLGMYFNMTLQEIEAECTPLPVPSEEPPPLAQPVISLAYENELALLKEQLNNETRLREAFQDSFRELVDKHKEYQQMIDSTGTENARLQQQLIEEQTKSLQQSVLLRHELESLRKLNEQLKLKNQSNEQTIGVLKTQHAKLEELVKPAAATSCMIFRQVELERATAAFHLQNKLGEGASGIVFKGRLGLIPVAIKRATDEPAALMTIKNEIRALNMLRHPNIVNLIGHTDLETVKNPCIVYDMMLQGNLRDRLDCHEGTPPLTWDARLRICFEIACALVHVHSANVLHMDVKTDNILLDSHYHARLADFGLVIFPPAPLNNNRQQTVVVHTIPQPMGTPGYMCPVLLQRLECSFKTDVFAFGVVMLEMLTGRTALQQQGNNGPPTNLSKLFLSTMKSPSDLVNPNFLDPHCQNA